MSSPRFIPVTVHKRDEFSETVSGHFEDAPDRKLVMRNLAGVPLWARPIARFLARREVRGLRAVAGIPGTPQLVHADDDALIRTWSEGLPLNLAKPADAAFYRSARRLLAALRQHGVTHNDLAKPQNWLMAPDGMAEVIDFQLVSVHHRKGRLYRLMAYEDLRHMLKQKRRYAPHLLTPTERRVVARKSLPARLWMATGKRLYNFVTRRVIGWSDGEGTQLDAAALTALRKRIIEHDGVRDARLYPIALPSKGVGLYAFIEGKAPADLPPEISAVHEVKTLPRDRTGAVRDDVLALIAGNRLDELEQVLAGDDALRSGLTTIVATRQNLTDRRLD